MTYIVVYSSKTGNTEIIAKAIKDTLDKDSCVYFGKIENNVMITQNSDIIFVGFYVYRGSCTEEIKVYLNKLGKKKIVLFGTAGFGGSESYYKSILSEIKKSIPESNEIIDSFMCQGKMPHSVLERYQKLLKDKPDDSNILNMISNYKSALSHPDEFDIEAVKDFVKKIFHDKLN